MRAGAGSERSQIQHRLNELAYGAVRAAAALSEETRRRQGGDMEESMRREA